MLGGAAVLLQRLTLRAAVCFSGIRGEALGCVVRNSRGWMQSRALTAPKMQALGGHAQIWNAARYGLPSRSLVVMTALAGASTGRPKRKAAAGSDDEQSPLNAATSRLASTSASAAAARRSASNVDGSAPSTSGRAAPPSQPGRGPSRMVMLAVDTDTRGAIAVISWDRAPSQYPQLDKVNVQLYDMPVSISVLANRKNRKEKKRRYVNMQAVLEMVRRVAAEHRSSADAEGLPLQLLAVLETPPIVMTDSAQSHVSSMYSVGVWHAALNALGFDAHTVPAKQWKTDMGLFGKGSQAAIFEVADALEAEAAAVAARRAADKVAQDAAKRAKKAARGKGSAASAAAEAEAASVDEEGSAESSADDVDDDDDDGDVEEEGGEEVEEGGLSGLPRKLPVAGKEAGRWLARGLFPQKAPLLSRKKDHGRSDALLLAAWALGCYVTHLGKPPQPVLGSPGVAPKIVWGPVREGLYDTDGYGNELVPEAPLEQQVQQVQPGRSKKAKAAPSAAPQPAASAPAAAPAAAAAPSYEAPDAAGDAGTDTDTDTAADDADADGGARAAGAGGGADADVEIEVCGIMVSRKAAATSKKKATSSVGRKAAGAGAAGNGAGALGVAAEGTTAVTGEAPAAKKSSAGGGKGREKEKAGSVGAAPNASSSKVLPGPAMLTEAVDSVAGMKMRLMGRTMSVSRPTRQTRKQSTAT